MCSSKRGGEGPLDSTLLLLDPRSDGSGHGLSVDLPPAGVLQQGTQARVASGRERAYDIPGIRVLLLTKGCFSSQPYF